MPDVALNLSLLLTNGRCLEKRSYYDNFENGTPVKCLLQAGLEVVVSPDLDSIILSTSKAVLSNLTTCGEWPFNVANVP
jgi:hypothetical protein